MSTISKKIKYHFKKAVIFVGLFLAVFFALFYIVNLDVWPLPKTSAQTSGQSQSLSDELKKRIGSTEISMADGSSLSYEAWARLYGLDSSNDGLDQDPDGSGLPNYLKYVYLTNPKNPDPNGKGFTDEQDVAGGYDPSGKKGTRPEVEITIDKIGVQAPVIWSASTDDAATLKDLESGLSHYPGSVAPGQDGNMIVSGHSSNYIWAKGNYNHIFKDLNDLEKGDTITIKTIQQNGRIITYTYQVSDKFVTSADDQKVFASTQDPTLTLSTCWPIGTNLKRLIIKAEIVK